MNIVFIDITRFSPVIVPRDIGHVSDGSIAAASRNLRFSGIGLVVGDFIVFLRLRFVVFTSCKFKPLIVRNAVVVCIKRHHNNARLAASCRPAVIGMALLHKCVPINFKIIFLRKIQNRMVKSEGDVTTKTAKRYRLPVVAGNGKLRFVNHLFFSVARLIFGQFIYELPRRRAVFKHSGNIGAVSHQLFNHHNFHGMHQRIAAVCNFAGNRVSSGFFSQKYQVPFFRQQ